MEEVAARASPNGLFVPALQTAEDGLMCVDGADSDDLEERKHFQRIVNAFKSYKIYSWKRLLKTLKYISSLPASHQEVLRNYKAHLGKVKTAIEHNYEVIKLVIKDVEHMFENADHSDDVKGAGEVMATVSDMDKVQGLFKQIVREWSADGEDERRACFAPILEEIEARFPADKVDVRQVKVLVPGAGLGRLAYEVARRGYICQGNEYSFFMLFASNFVLNRCKGVNLFTVYPWIHQFHNHLTPRDQIRTSVFPDVNPSDLPPNSDFSMAAGNFTEVYHEPDTWDCVATCFFIDTANNVVAYVETIWTILKPGGYWVNLGPLLYHFADLPNEDSIEPSYEELKEIIGHFGFKFLREDVSVRTPYTQNVRSMMLYEYRSAFFVCQKPPS